MIFNTSTDLKVDAGSQPVLNLAGKKAVRGRRFFAAYSTAAAAPFEDDPEDARHQQRDQSEQDPNDQPDILGLAVVVLLLCHSWLEASGVLVLASVDVDEVDHHRDLGGGGLFQGAFHYVRGLDQKRLLLVHF